MTRPQALGGEKLQFKPMKGFKVHRRRSNCALRSMRRHTTIKSDDSGELHLTKKLYKPPKASRLIQVAAPSRPVLPNLTAIPRCVDNFPEGVDLSILDNVPKQRPVSDFPLLNWMNNDREGFLRELIRFEGRCGITTCTVCKTCPAIYRCHDCLTLNLYCKECVILKHTSQPLHHVREWQGSYWRRTSLKEIGLIIQLGHPSGEVCYLPKAPHSDDFVIIHGNGIHSVKLRLCGCETAETPTQQLLRYRLFPATTDKPRTAATFGVLEEYHLLSLESKVSAHHFYNSLARRNNNTGLSPSKDRYEQFMRMAHEWRHLKLLKRSGRGHDSGGVDGTKEGQCCVICPACPHPGINLPEDWDKMPKDKEWLHALFVAIDANFRLKRRAVSKDSVDPSLSKGWSYFVEELSYKLYLDKNSNTMQEKSNCSGHIAVNNADTKCSKGLAASGVGSICCARHEMKLPGGVGDLQKGERYVNMDYLFFSTLRNTPLKTLNVSYDIACQWSRHLWERMDLLPYPMHFAHEEKKITFFVPKFHLPAHVAECQWKYSFNFTKGVARTDGEAPERGWSTLNAAASSTKEMGPGHRRDTLNDLIGDGNWKKLIGLGKSILSKIKEAVPERDEHEEDLHEFEASLVGQYGVQLTQWKDDIGAWEADPSKPNPFEVRSNVITQASVRLQLVREEAFCSAVPDIPTIHSEVSASELISTGLDLEEQQFRLRLELENITAHATDRQSAKLQQQSNSLVRRIDTWRNIQILYMPCVASLRAAQENIQSSDDHVPRPEQIHLLLPSALGAHIPCDKNLREVEWKLRVGQAHDALEDLRQALRSRSYMLRFKDRFLRGQGSNTRARNSLKLVDAKVEVSGGKYRIAYSALLALSHILQKTGWQTNFHFLKDEDMRPMTEGTHGRSSEGRRRISWIWIVCGYGEGSMPPVEGGSDQEILKAVRLEWCKTRARAHRWAEEVTLLVEEQRRILQFLRWQERWWLDKQSLIETDNSALQEGLKAYALRQAAIRNELREHFSVLWQDTDTYIQLGSQANHNVANGYTIPS